MNLNERIMRGARLAAPIYHENGWTWGDSPNEHIPDVGEIAMTITMLAEPVLAGGGTASCSSGRLSVEADPDDGEVSVYVELVCLREGDPRWVFQPTADDIGGLA